jgi:uncharacterized lipoprotein YajG
MRRIIQKIQLVAFLLAAVLFSGCALTKDEVSLGYTPQPSVSKVSGADHVPVTVTVKDARQDKTAVGAKINGFGMETAPIVSRGDVIALVENAIETELTDRGFKLNATNGVSLVAELSTFRNHFKVGFWAGDAVADITLEITVKNVAGTIVYNKLVQGQGMNENIQLATGSNAKVALEAALSDAMTKMFSDQAFIDALLQPAKP